MEKRKLCIFLFIFLIAIITGFNASLVQSDRSWLNDSTFRIFDRINYTAPDSSFPAEGVPVLMYHSISYDSENSLKVSPEQFSEEMAWLAQQDYHTITMDELYQALVCGDPIPDQSVVITFDDGYADNYEAAWPILKQYGFCATFFVITDKIGTSGYLSWEQLEELSGAGNSVGSHSVHHYELSTLNYEQQKRELSESKQILEDRLNIDIKAFCYPSGKYNDTTLALLEELGYTLACTTVSGKVNEDCNPFELKRIRIGNNMSISLFMKQFE